MKVFSVNFDKFFTFEFFTFHFSLFISLFTIFDKWKTCENLWKSSTYIVNDLQSLRIVSVPIFKYFPALPEKFMMLIKKLIMLTKNEHKPLGGEKFRHHQWILRPILPGYTNFRGLTPTSVFISIIHAVKQSFKSPWPICEILTSFSLFIFYFSLLNLTFYCQWKLASEKHLKIFSYNNNILGSIQDV